MLIEFENLSKHDFALCDINILYRKPIYQTTTIKSRRNSAFIYVISGKAVCEFQGLALEFHPESVYHMPFGSGFKITVLEKPFEFYRIDFQLSINGEFAFFSNTPIRITDSVSAKFRDAVTELDEECKYGDSKIVKLEKLCAIFSSLSASLTSLYQSSIGPALRYLDEHFTEHLDCHMLAALCFLSTAQFYNLFRERVGTTPLEYKNRLVIHRAKSLLADPEMTITHASDTLGFASVAYFSRFFKKHTGICPSDFVKQNRNF